VTDETVAETAAETAAGTTDETSDETTGGTTGGTIEGTTGGTDRTAAVPGAGMIDAMTVAQMGRQKTIENHRKPWARLGGIFRAMHWGLHSLDLRRFVTVGVVVCLMVPKDGYRTL
jgi:hypothetical protein